MPLLMENVALGVVGSPAWTQSLSAHSFKTGGEPQPPEHAVSEWALGIFLCLAGAAATNLGLTLQKRSFLNNDAASPSRQKAATKQPLWLSGLAIFIAGQTLNLLAFGYTSQAVAATLGSFSLVTNGVFAPLLLRERLTGTIIFSIGVIVTGSVAVVLASSHVPQEYTLDQLVHLLERPLFVTYLSFLVISLVLSVALMLREDKAWNQHQQAADEWEAQEAGRALQYTEGEEIESLSQDVPASFTVSSSGLQLDPELAGRGTVFTKQPPSFGQVNHFKKVEVQPAKTVNTWHDHRSSSERDALLGTRLHSNPPPPERSPTSSGSSSLSSSPDSPGRPAPPSALSPILAGAILSSMSVLFGKCTIQLVKASLGGDNQFVHPLSWLLTIVFLSCAIGAVAFLNVGLRRGTALFVVPLYYVLNTLLAIIGGLVYFEEFKRFLPLQGTLFAAGVATTIGGVWISSRGQAALEDGGEESDVEGEDEEDLEVEREDDEERAMQEEDAKGLTLLQSQQAATATHERQRLAVISATGESSEENTPSPGPGPLPSASPPGVGAAAAAALPPAPSSFSSPSPSPESPMPGTTPVRKPSGSALKPCRSIASDMSDAGATRPRKSSLSVRFGMEGLGPAQGVWPISTSNNGALPRMGRTQSEPGLVPTDQELAQAAASAAQVSERTALHSGASTIASQPRGSTARLQASGGYGSLDKGQERGSFRTPQPQRRSIATAAADVAASTGKGPLRARSMSSLTPSVHDQQQQSRRLIRDRWRRAAAASGSPHSHHKRYSLDHLAYQSSFGNLVNALSKDPVAKQTAASAAAETPEPQLRPKPVERRYSVAVLGLGVS